MQTDRGRSIEDESMRMIDEEVGAHHYTEKEWPIVRRIIHSTADFDFAGDNRVIFHKEAIAGGMRALGRGCSIVTDVNGVAGLLNKQNLSEFGNKLVCKISDGDVASAAKREGKTRSQVSMRLSGSEIDGGVVAIGNAPTALLEVVNMIKEGTVRPALVVGIPVGFVCAAESKEALASTDVPFITNRGRKGGSSSAAAVINALFRMVRESAA